MYNTLWYVGSIIAAWTVFGTLKYAGDAAWRIPVGLQALMPFIQFVGIWFLPESPRWLVSKDKAEQALKVLVKVRIMLHKQCASANGSVVPRRRQSSRCVRTGRICRDSRNH